MLLKNKKVAIIGAGPVGLTMAILLQQKGSEAQSESEINEIEMRNPDFSFQTLIL